VRDDVVDVLKHYSTEIYSVIKYLRYVQVYDLNGPI